MKAVRSKSTLCFAACTVLFALWSTAQGQQPKKVYRIGYITNRAETGPNEEAFRRRLRELGYVEGENLVIEWRFTGAQLDRNPEVAAELVRLKVDCIVAAGLGASRAAKQATNTIPIVMANVSDDPVRNKLIDSLARPGGNITGFTDIAHDLAGKRLELIKETLPGISRVAYLWNLANPTATRVFRETERASPQLGMQLQPLKVQGPDNFQNAFKVAIAQRAGVLFVWEDAVLLPHRTRILDLATKHRLPAASQYREFAEAGGLLSYGPNLPDQFRRAAYYVDKILKGAKPADLPVEQPKKFELIINLKAAKQIGLTIPPNVLVRADKVIK